MAPTLDGFLLASEGNIGASSFHRATKDDAVRCWLSAVHDAKVDDKVLAAECGISKSYYSKVSTGQQGDLFALAYRLPPHRASIRAAFYARLADIEHANPLEIAAEELTVAAVRWLRLRGTRMAKADLKPSAKSEVA